MVGGRIQARIRTGHATGHSRSLRGSKRTGRGSHQAVVIDEEHDHFIDVHGNANSRSGDGGRFRLYKLGATCTRALEGAKQRVRAAIQAFNDLHQYKMIREEEWQVHAAAELLLGGDTFVITATASGKSMCFLLAILADPSIIVFVVCPLISLMRTQVQGAQMLGIRACSVDHASTASNRSLVQAVVGGDFQLVLASPEWCDRINVDFLKITETGCAFMRRLRGLVVDEAHLTQTWQTFRPRYATLGTLRSIIRCGVMALTATSTPYIRRFVHNTTRMVHGATLIHPPTGIWTG